MSHEPKKKGPPKPIQLLFEYSVFLIVGALAALAWANIDPGVKDDQGNVVRQSTYTHFIKFEFWHLFYDEAPATGHQHPPGEAHNGDETDRDSGEVHPHEPTGEEGKGSAATHGGDGHEGGHPLNIEWFVNNVLMAFFFAIAAKEVWEALLPGGPLSNPRKAATPLIATLGGIIGPAGMYIAAVLICNYTVDPGQWGALGKGWAIPCATDIAFSYLVARLIFGAGHPAIAFLLLLAIADDAAGLVIIAVAYPSGPLHLIWLLLPVLAVGIGIAFRYMRVTSFWWYLAIPGAISWFGFHMAGIHSSLGLVPIIPVMPSAQSDLGLFARKELDQDDTLNAFEHWWKNPVEIILGLFGLINAGVVFSSAGYGTAWVLLGLLVGKPIGITLFTWVGQKLFRLEIPGGLTYRHIVTLGMVAGIGFTVALFVSGAAFHGGDSAVLDATKMGALLSFGAVPLAFILGRLLGIRPNKPGDVPPEEKPEEDAPA